MAGCTKPPKLKDQFNLERAVMLQTRTLYMQTHMLEELMFLKYKETLQRNCLCDCGCNDTDGCWIVSDC